MQVQKLPEKVQEFINSYLELKIGEHTVRTPYFRNVKRVRAELRSLIGKGTPEEIAEETLIYAKLRGFSFADATPESIRKFMQSQGIGVDCSGFVAHVLNTWLKSERKGHLSQRIKFPKASLYRKLVRRLRPIENVSADLLTGPLNADPVKLSDVQVGDLIRLKGVKRGDHVAMISEVVREEGRLKGITYVHSEELGEDNGIQFGKIKITDETKDLAEQDWEKCEGGACWQLDRLKKEPEDTGLRRLKFFAN